MWKYFLVGAVIGLDVEKQNSKLCTSHVQRETFFKAGLFFMTFHCILLFNSFAAHLTVTQTIILYTALILLSPCESPVCKIIHMTDFIAKLLC